MSQQEPSEEELRAALEEQMRRITVPDVLIQTVVTLINLGGRRLGLAGPPEQAGEKDPEQARLAIEGARALLPLLPQQEELKPVRDALSQLQMAYVQEAGGGGQGAEAEGQVAQPEPEASSQSEPDAAAEAERAKARSKIWTPPGA
ncbi:MAG: hypothetical protein QOI19_422 [Thermoleophilaceae bacterium]|jgi:hypothetical protein|nr:hypothetical protein [Thermoleophilaceae bacterium]